MTDSSAEAASSKQPVANKSTLYCSFCGKSQHEARKLIAGPTVFICDECVDLCMDIVHEERAGDVKSLLANVRVPGGYDSLAAIRIDSFDELLKLGDIVYEEGGYCQADNLLRAVFTGLDKLRTEFNMTPERAARIRAAENELYAVEAEFEKIRQRHNLEAAPLKARLGALLRGEPIDTAGEVEKLPEPEPRLEPVPGLETATLTRSSDEATE